MKKIILAIPFLTMCFLNSSYASKLPDGFVYLKDVAPSIIQDIRYSGYHNFVGRPVKGYHASQCILTKQAATQLAKVQQELLQSNLSLKVFDCYRPTQAVKDFVAWSKITPLNPTKKEFYPNVNKKDFFKLGYVAEESGHSRGSTIDLTVVRMPLQHSAHYRPGQPLVACTAPYHVRFNDSSIDMGTGFDCLDPSSYSDNKNIGTVAYFNRLMLRSVMKKYGFTNYEKEWWHFTLDNEPYPKQYFNFPVA